MRITAGCSDWCQSSTDLCEVQRPDEVLHLGTIGCRCTPQKLTPRLVPAHSDDGGRRDGYRRRRDERRVAGVRSESYVVLGHAEGQDPTRNVVVHGCNGKSRSVPPWIALYA